LGLFSREARSYDGRIIVARVLRSVHSNVCVQMTKARDNDSDYVRRRKEPSTIKRIRVGLLATLWHLWCDIKSTDESGAQSVVYRYAKA
jgi:hypothetical protein